MNSNLQLRVLFTAVLLFSAGSNLDLFAQNDQGDLNIKAGSSFFVNPTGFEEELPFWLHANRYGVVDQSSANTLGYISGNGAYDFNKNFSLEGGADIYTRFEDHSAFVNKFYARIKGYDFALSAGKFIDPLTMKEDELSSGSFMYSRNASPIPKIAFHTDGFAAVPGTNGIVRYNALFAHGWFEDDRYVRDAYLHEKYFYLGIKYDFFDAVGGIVHNVQWGGVSQDRGQLPSGLETFWEVITATGSSDPDAPGGEQSNAVGNSIAAYDFSLGLFFDKFDMRAYRLFYLEDKVSTRFRSPWDGVWGLTVKPKGIPFIQNFLWEHINTKRQDSFDFEPRGTASYYNNFVYRTGWTYQRRVIGNPLLLSDGSINRPIYNNIIIAHHFGLAGEITKNLQYKFLYTFSRNYGESNDQIIERLPREDCSGTEGTVCATLRPLSSVKEINHSFLVELYSDLQFIDKLRYGIYLSSDVGELYDNRFGFGINLEYDILSGN